ncbi:MAG: aspartyl/asparaginyl beta-hydroxylase domain-containing protein [Steroidobacteraceae bacterium]
MLIDTPIRPLGFVDSRRLTERVLAADESAWHLDTRRQDDYEVHVETQSIILVFFDGWPTVNVAHGSGWDAFADLAMPVMEELVAKHYPPGGMVLRVVLARLLPGRQIEAHTDKHPSFSIAHRIHVPLLTNPGVEFIVGTERIATRPQYAFELNNKLPHSVANRGDTARIHLIFDYSPSQE